MVFSDVKVRYKFLLFPSPTKRTYTTIFIRFNAESSLGSHSKLSRDPVARTYAAIPNPEDRWPPPSAQHSMTQTVFPARNLSLRFAKFDFFRAC